MNIKQSLRKLLHCFFLFALCNHFSTVTSAQGFLKADGKKIVTANGENIILRGMGLGGWMLQEGYMFGIYKDAQQHKIKAKIEEVIGREKTKEFYKAWLENDVRKIDIDSMKAWGFNSVRLPMHYNLYTLPVDLEPVAGQNTWLDPGFRMTDSLLSWCKANHMYLILDLHAAPGGQGNDLNIADRDDSKPSLWDNEANKQKTIALWKKIAEHYKDEQWIGAYDILNEPNWGFADTANDRNGLNEPTNAPLKKLSIDITNAIREADKNHIIIIEGNGWGNNYNGMLPPWDSNMVLSFHKYWDYNKTENIQRIIDARNKYHVPVWLGETGENSNVWFTQVITLLEKNNIGWAMWPLKKMGANGPLEIVSNPDYIYLKNYINGNGKKPKEGNAYNALMKLAVASKLENSIFHKDVTDALFRQPFSAEAVPYHDLKLTDRLIIPAVNYDLGRNGIAYYDTDTANYRVSGVNSEGNRGHTYRNDGVDIFKDSIKNNTWYVSNIEDGEWLQYSTNVMKKGMFTFKIIIAPGKESGEIVITSYDKSFAKKIEIPAKNKNNELRTLLLKNVFLPQGINRLQIKSIKGGFNLYAIQIFK